MAQAQPHSTTLPEQSPSKHLLQQKSATYPNLPEIPLHLLWIHLWQTTHLMELSPTPCLHTPHGYFPDSSAWPIFTWHLITFVLPMFTLRPFNSIPLLHLRSFSISNSSVSATRTRSSAYSNSMGNLSLNSLDKASNTMINSNGLRTEPIKPNCILSIFTIFLTLLSMTLSRTFMACSTNFIPLYEPHATTSPFPL